MRKTAISAITLFAAIFFFSYTPVLYPQTQELVKFEKAKSLFQKGYIYYNKMEYLAAVEFFRQALNEYPEYATARDYLARSYAFSGYTDAALKELESLKDISGNSAAVSMKIDNIKFRDSISGMSTGFSELILNTSYESNNFKTNNFPYPIDITADNDKNVYITSFSTGKLVKIDANGKAVASFRPSLTGQLYGVDYKNGKLAVTNFKEDLFYIMSTDGTILKKIGGSGNEAGKFHGPEGICFDNGGYIYVVDSGNSRVQKFDDEGNFILKFGEKGEYEAQFDRPSDVAVYKNSVYVTDTGNRRLAVFDDSGNFSKNIKIEYLDAPRGINRFDTTLFISDEKNGLLFYNPENDSKKWMSSWNGEKDKFIRLYSSMVDRDGHLYCLDYSRQTAFLFSPVQKMYSNLDLEVLSVDAKKFPVVAYYVNVRGRDGRPIYGLKSENFRITEDGAHIRNMYSDYLRKKVSTSVSMVMNFDRSKEMSQYHNELSWLSEFILKKMLKNDVIKIQNFNDEIWEGNKFDWSRRRALKAIKEKKYSSGKVTGQALYNSISDLAPLLSRRAVILVTDGKVIDDSFRKYTPEVIIAYAKAHYVPVYIISFGNPDPVLARIADSTGGALIRPKEVDSLRTVYDRIKSSEENRYVIVYSTFKPAKFKGLWSDVKIEVEYKGQKGIERSGYFVP